MSARFRRIALDRTIVSGRRGGDPDLEAFARSPCERAGIRGIDRLRDGPQLLDRVVRGARRSS